MTTAQQFACPQCTDLLYCRHDDGRTIERHREAVCTMDADVISHLLALGIQFGIAARLESDQPGREVNARALTILNRMAKEVSRG